MGSWGRPARAGGGRGGRYRPRRRERLGFGARLGGRDGDEVAGPAEAALQVAVGQTKLLRSTVHHGGGGPAGGAQ